MSDPFELVDPPPPRADDGTDDAPSGGAPPVAPSEAPYLAQLNDTQRQAVEATEGPVLVLAGAGTGKTRVLTTRLAHVLLTGKARPWEVLAVTFTNRAANQMKERVADLMGGSIEGWWVGTFHALGARILRSHAEAVGLGSNFTILDEDDQIRLVKQLIAARDIEEKDLPSRMVLAIIQRWKDRGLTPDKVTDAEGAKQEGDRVLGLYGEYQERLANLNAVDFGDLLLHCLGIFRDQPQVVAQYQEKFRYILVDEYQDSNVAQYLWLRLLAQGHRNICCVGDDDQSIYSWRGAEVGNILRFETDFPGARVIRLERNYRSTRHILGAASGLIARNETRLGKTLWTEIEEGDKVRLRGVWDGAEEARVVGEEIEALHRDKHSLNEIAVLVRAGFQTREFEERLITLGVPYRVIGGPRFYERAEIRDAVAYLRVIAQPDDDLAFERIVNLPRRGIGPATMRTVHMLARAEGTALTRAVARLVETDELKPRARHALGELLRDFGRWRGLAANMGPGELAGLVLDESGYTGMWRESQALDAPGRLDNLKELVAALGEFGDMREFLEHVSLVMENEESTAEEKVNLMTLHGAKGLEFDTVFLPGWEEGLFPHPRTLDEAGVKGLEEERRLAHVGLTRARRRATVLFASSRKLFGRWQSAIPSRFIDELPAEHVEAEVEMGLHAGSAPGRGEGGLSETPGIFATGLETAWESRRGGARRLIDNPDWRLEAGDAAVSGLAVGQRVFHQKFGYGGILAIDGHKLEIAFEKAGTKMVMDSFVRAQ